MLHTGKKGHTKLLTVSKLKTIGRKQNANYFIFSNTATFKYRKIKSKKQ